MESQSQTFSGLQPLSVATDHVASDPETEAKHNNPGGPSVDPGVGVEGAGGRRTVGTACPEPPPEFRLSGQTPLRLFSETADRAMAGEDTAQRAGISFSHESLEQSVLPIETGLSSG